MLFRNTVAGVECERAELGLGVDACKSESVLAVQGESAPLETRATPRAHHRNVFIPGAPGSTYVYTPRKHPAAPVQEESAYVSPRTTAGSDVSDELFSTPAGTPAPDTPALELPAGSEPPSSFEATADEHSGVAAAASPGSDEATAELGSDAEPSGEVVRVLSPLSASQRWLPQPPVGEHAVRCRPTTQPRAKARNRSASSVPLKPAALSKPPRAPSAARAQVGPQAPPRSRLPARPALAHGADCRGTDRRRSTTVPAARKPRHHTVQSPTARGGVGQKPSRQPPTPTRWRPQPTSATAAVAPRPPDTGVCRKDRRVTLEHLFHSHDGCSGSTRCHVRAVLTCLPPGVRKAVLAWSEISARAETDRGRYARTVVREMKRLLHTLCGTGGRRSAAGTAALGAALRDLVGVSPWAELHPKPRCPRAADTYGLLMSCVTAAMSHRTSGRAVEVMEVEAAPVGADSDQMHMAGQLAAVLDGHRPVSAVCRPPDVEELRHVSGSHVLAVERRGERRFAVASMLLMRVAVETLRAAPQGDGFAEVLADRLHACLCGVGGGGGGSVAGARPALIQVPGTVTVEFDWSSSTNVGLLLPLVEFLPLFFAKACRFDLQHVAATQSGEPLPFHARCSSPSPLPMPRVLRRTSEAQHANAALALGCYVAARVVEMIHVNLNAACVPASAVDCSAPHPWPLRRPCIS